MTRLDPGIHPAEQRDARLVQVPHADVALLEQLPLVPAQPLQHRRHAGRRRRRFRELGQVAPRRRADHDARGCDPVGRRAVHAQSFGDEAGGMLDLVDARLDRVVDGQQRVGVGGHLKARVVGRVDDAPQLPSVELRS